MGKNRLIALTGAGCHADVGGFLASEVWGRLLAYPEIRNTRLRKYFVNELDFERIVQRVREDRDEIPREEYLGFESCLVRVYRAMTLLERVHVVERAGDKVLSALRLCTGGPLFTLNQDLFVEMCQHISGSVVRRPFVDDFDGWGNLDRSLSDLDSKFDSLRMTIPLNRFKMSASTRKKHSFEYVKLHGSIDWYSESDQSPILVLGVDKEKQRTNVKLLQRYHSLFAESISRPGVKLLVVGYSFRDTHINRVIADACRTDGLQIFVWNAASPAVMRTSLREYWPIGASQELEDCETIWRNLGGYLSRGMLDVVSPPLGGSDWTIQQQLGDWGLL